MGLDQYGGWLAPKKVQAKDDNVVQLHLEQEGEEAFTWRKHARLQQYMHDLFCARNKDTHFNCKKLFLSEKDVLDLQKKIQEDNLPFCDGGFFWGHQFQEEAMRESKEYDLKFCEEALKWLEEDKQVYYECWW